MTTRPTQGGKKRIANPAANDDRISPKLIGSIVSVGSLAFIGILTETVMTVLFPELMVEFSVNTATVQWITTIYRYRWVSPCPSPLISSVVSQ